MSENEIRQSRKFRNHISVILEQTGAVLAAAVVLVVTQIVQQIDEIANADLSFFTEKGFLIVLGIVAVLLLSLAAQVAVWSRTYIWIEENAIVIEKGRVNRKKNTIGIRNISNINLEQNLIEMLFGTCKVKLDTNSLSTADSTDVRIVLKKPDALWFQQEVMRKMEGASGPAAGGKDTAGGSAYAAEAVHSAYPAVNGAEDYDVRAGIADIIRHGFFSISILSVILFLLAAAGAAVSIAEMFGGNRLTSSLAGTAAAVLVAGSILFSTLWDTVKDFVRYYDFRAKRLGDKIYIKYGFFKKVEYTIPADKIQALKIRQSFVARAGHRYMAEIVNVGMGDDQEEKNSFLLLYCRKDELKERLSLLLPEFAAAVELDAERQPASVWAAWAVPAAVCAVFAAGCAFLVNELTGDKYSLYVWIAAAALVIMMLAGRLLQYGTAGVGADDMYLKIVGGCFAKQSVSVRYRNIQYVQFSQNFIARACGIKKGEIHLLASSSNTSHSIPYFRGDKDEIIKRGMLIF